MAEIEQRRHGDQDAAKATDAPAPRTRSTTPGHALVSVPADLRYWWDERYLTIMKDLEFSVDDDARATAAFASMLETMDTVVGRDIAPPRLKPHVVILGAADRLLDDLDTIAQVDTWDDASIVVADSALATALEHGVRPDLVVTDLDGDAAALITTSGRGTTLAVHAHGDNQTRVREILPRLLGPIIPTGQHPLACERHDILCPGGFTDGDRAAILAHLLGAKEIHLAGFDLTGPPGTLTGKTAGPLKARKLSWAKRNLRDLAGHGASIRYV